VALLSDGCGCLRVSAIALPLRRCATGKRRKNILHAVVDQADLTIKRADSALGALRPTSVARRRRRAPWSVIVATKRNLQSCGGDADRRGRYRACRARGGLACRTSRARPGRRDVHQAEVIPWGTQTPRSGGCQPLRAAGRQPWSGYRQSRRPIRSAGRCRCRGGRSGWPRWGPGHQVRSAARSHRRSML